MYETLKVQNAGSDTKVLIVHTEQNVTDRTKEDKLGTLIEIIDEPFIAINRNSICVITNKEFENWNRVRGRNKFVWLKNGFSHDLTRTGPITLFPAINNLEQFKIYHGRYLRDLNEFRHYQTRKDKAILNMEECLAFMDENDRDFEYHINGGIQYIDDVGTTRVAYIAEDTNFKIRVINKK